MWSLSRYLHCLSKIIATQCVVQNLEQYYGNWNSIVLTKICQASFKTRWTAHINETFPSLEKTKPFKWDQKGQYSLGVRCSYSWLAETSIASQWLTGCQCELKGLLVHQCRIHKAVLSSAHRHGTQTQGLPVVPGANRCLKGGTCYFLYTLLSIDV